MFCCSAYIALLFSCAPYIHAAALLCFYPAVFSFVLLFCLSSSFPLLFYAAVLLRHFVFFCTALLSFAFLRCSALLSCALLCPTARVRPALLSTQKPPTVPHPSGVQLNLPRRVRCVHDAGLHADTRSFPGFLKLRAALHSSFLLRFPDFSKRCGLCITCFNARVQLGGSSFGVIKALSPTRASSIVFRPPHLCRVVASGAPCPCIVGFQILIWTL